MLSIFTKANSSLARYLPERTLIIQGQEDQRELHFSPIVLLLLSVSALLLTGWFVVATTITVSGSFEADNTIARNLALQDAYELRLSELAEERDSYARHSQTMQERFELALEQVSSQQDELIDAMTTQNEQQITLIALQDRLKSAVSERDAAQSALEGIQAEFASMAIGSGPRDSSEHELVSILLAMNSALSDAVTVRDAAIDETQELENQIFYTAQRIELDNQRRDRMMTQLENAVQLSLSPLETMFERSGLDVDSLLATVRLNYSGTGGLVGEMLPESIFNDNSEPDQRLQALMDQLDLIQVLNIAGNRLPLSMPVTAAVRHTSGFGPRNGRMHKGIDLAGPVGTPIYAPAEGTVIFSGWLNGYGKAIKIQHDFGYITVYGHMSKLHVDKGDTVSRGEQIGDMGNTGRSTGSHLHYEIRLNNNAQDPMTLIKAGQNVF